MTATQRCAACDTGRDLLRPRLASGVAHDMGMTFTDIALGADRLPFHRHRQQVIDDIERTRDLGATELILDLQTSTCSPDELIDTALQLADPHRALLAA